MKMYKIFNWDLFDGSSKSIKALGIAISRYHAMGHPFPTPFDKQLFKTEEEMTRVQNFRSGIEKIQNFAVQNLSTTADFPEFLNDLFKTFLDKPISDIGYQSIFDVQPTLNGADGWDVYTETSDFEFNEILPGGLISYFTQTGSKYRAYVDYYGGGNGIDQRLLDSRRFVEVERMIERSRAVVMKKEAQVAYALIEAIGAGQDIAWQNPDPAALPNTDATYNANRDAQTMNKAAETLISVNKDKGLMPDGLNTNFFVLYPYQLQGRLQKANSVRLQAFDNSNRELSVYNFFFISTTLLASSTQYYIGIPKGKLTGGVLLNLTQFMQFNQTTYTQDIANWKAFGFDIGDATQVQRCKTS
jgi:hypothetical protein